MTHSAHGNRPGSKNDHHDPHHGDTIIDEQAGLQLFAGEEWFAPATPRSHEEGGESAGSIGWHHWTSTFDFSNWNDDRDWGDAGGWHDWISSFDFGDWVDTKDWGGGGGWHDWVSSFDFGSWFDAINWGHDSGWRGAHSGGSDSYVIDNMRDDGTGSRGFDFGIEAPPTIQHTSVSILPTDIEATENTYGKPSFNYDQAAAHITRGNTKWNDEAFTSNNALGTPGTVTYAYSATPSSGNIQVNAAMLAFSEQAVAAIGGVADLTFTRIGTGTTGPQAYSDAAEISIEAIPGYGGGWASWSYWGGSGGNLNAFAGVTVANGATAGYSEEDDYGMLVSLHELGHSVGLLHPGDYNGSGATTYEAQAEYFEDSRQYTVMSYWSESKTGADYWAYAYTGNGSEWVGGYPTNLMLHDIAALQSLYGANMTTRTDDTIYGFNSNTGDFTWELSSAADSIIAAVWDAGGNDTLDLSGFYENADVDLREEAFSSFGGLKWNFSIAQGAIIENAIGGFGDDVLSGNAADNYLAGMEGDDQFYGLDGNDTVNGGPGDDLIVAGFGAGNDNYDGGDDIDTITYASTTQGVYVHLIQGIATGAEIDSDTLANIENVIGGSGADTIIGDNGDNTIDGGGGDDTIVGRNGADILFGGDGEDFINGMAGRDEIHGGDDADTLYGRAGWDTIYGNDGADFIRGFSGNDVLFGGAGNDLMRGDAGLDTLDGGTDNDELLGGNGIDRLFGGAGDDDLTGGKGGGVFDGFSDTFVFADTASGGGGTDTILDWEDGIDQIDLKSFGFTDFTTEVLALASDGASGLEIDFGGGDMLVVENFLKLDFDAGDVLFV